jgi:hypothetical protein
VFGNYWWVCGFDGIAWFFMQASIGPKFTQKFDGRLDLKLQRSQHQHSKKFNSKFPGAVRGVQDDDATRAAEVLASAAA